MNLAMYETDIHSDVVLVEEREVNVVEVKETAVPLGTSVKTGVDASVEMLVKREEVMLRVYLP